jgi:hypothetical protein
MLVNCLCVYLPGLALSSLPPLLLLLLLLLPGILTLMKQNRSCAQ